MTSQVTFLCWEGVRRGSGTVVNSPRLTLVKSAQAQAGFFSFLFLFQDPMELQVFSEGANPWTIHSRFIM